MKHSTSERKNSNGKVPAELMKEYVNSQKFTSTTET